MNSLQTPVTSARQTNRKAPHRRGGSFPRNRSHLRWLHEEERHDDAQLQQYEEEGDDELGAGRHEARFLGADLLLAASQDPGDAVGLGFDRKTPSEPPDYSYTHHR